MLKNICLLFTSLIICTGCITKHSEYTFGMKPEAKIDASVAAVKLIGQLQSRKDTAHVTVTIPKGRYDFYPDSIFSTDRTLGRRCGHRKIIHKLNEPSDENFIHPPCSCSTAFLHATC